VTSVVYSDFSSIQVLAGEIVNCVTSIALVVETDESESTRLSMFVLWNVDVSDFSELSESSSKTLSVGAIGKIVDLERGHSSDVWWRPAGHVVWSWF